MMTNLVFKDYPLFLFPTMYLQKPLHPLGLHDKDYDDLAASQKMQYVHGKDRFDPQMGAYGHNLCINDGLGVARYGKSEKKKLVKL